MDSFFKNLRDKLSIENVFEFVEDGKVIDDEVVNENKISKPDDIKTNSYIDYEEIKTKLTDIRKNNEADEKIKNEEIQREENKIEEKKEEENKMEVIRYDDERKEHKSDERKEHKNDERKEHKNDERKEEEYINEDNKNEEKPNEEKIPEDMQNENDLKAAEPDNATVENVNEVQKEPPKSHDTEMTFFF